MVTLTICIFAHSINSRFFRFCFVCLEREGEEITCKSKWIFSVSFEPCAHEIFYSIFSRLFALFPSLSLLSDWIIFGSNGYFFRTPNSSFGTFNRNFSQFNNRQTLHIKSEKMWMENEKEKRNHLYWKLFRGVHVCRSFSQSNYFYLCQTCNRLPNNCLVLNMLNSS